MFNVFRKPLPKRNNIGSAEKSVFYYIKFQKGGNAHDCIILIRRLAAQA